MGLRKSEINKRKLKIKQGMIKQYEKISSDISVRSYHPKSSKYSIFFPQAFSRYYRFSCQNVLTDFFFFFKAPSLGKELSVSYYFQ